MKKLGGKDNERGTEKRDERHGGSGREGDRERERGREGER